MMRVFELHFNPKGREDRIFDSFVYEPEEFPEKQLGTLYVAGELMKILPQNAHFLKELSSQIQNSYYRQASLQAALQQANQFLDKETKQGNVNWLGNLNLAVLNLKEFVLNFTKVGNIKILLIREGEVLDLSQNLELQDAESYSLKVFSHTAVGKLSPEDKILVLTKEIFNAVSQNENFINQIRQVNSAKDLKKIFKAHKQTFSEISGVCQLIMSDTGPIRSLSLGRFLRWPKKTILIIALFFIVLLSYGFFGQERNKEDNRVQNILSEARSKILVAESLLILKEEEKAQALFQEAWDALSLVIESGTPLAKEAASLQVSIQEYLK